MNKKKTIRVRRPQGVDSKKLILKKLKENPEEYLKSILEAKERPLTALYQKYIMLYNILAVVESTAVKGWKGMQKNYPLKYYRNVLLFLKKAGGKAQEYGERLSEQEYELPKGGAIEDLNRHLHSMKLLLLKARTAQVFALMRDVGCQWKVMEDANLFAQILDDINDHLGYAMKNPQDGERLAHELHLNLMLAIFQNQINSTASGPIVEHSQGMKLYLKNISDYYNQYKDGVVPSNVEAINRQLSDIERAEKHDVLSALVGLMDAQEMIAADASLREFLLLQTPVDGTNALSSIKALLFQFDGVLARPQTHFNNEMNQSVSLTGRINPKLVALLSVARKQLGMSIGVLTDRDYHFDQGYPVLVHDRRDRGIICMESYVYSGQDTVLAAITAGKMLDLFAPQDIVYCNHMEYSVLPNGAKLFPQPLRLWANISKENAFNSYLKAHPDIKADQVAVFDNKEQSIAALPTEHKFVNATKDGHYYQYDANQLINDVFKVLLRVVLYSNEYLFDKRIDAAHGLLALRNNLEEINDEHWKRLDVFLAEHRHSRDSTLSAKRFLTSPEESASKRMKQQLPGYGQFKASPQGGAARFFSLPLPTPTPTPTQNNQVVFIPISGNKK